MLPAGVPCLPQKLSQPAAVDQGQSRACEEPAELLACWQRAMQAAALCTSSLEQRATSRMKALLRDPKACLSQQ